MNNAPRNAPNESATAAPQPHVHAVDEACVDLLHEATDDKPGIVNVNVDTQNKVMSFGYVPELVSRPDLDRIAQELAPTLHQRLETCTLRIGHVGGRACESCALGLERRMSRVPGVRHASASYLGGVLSVTYDGALLSPGAIARQVKEYGVPLVPASDGEETLETVAEPPGLSRRMRTWITRDHLAVVFTAITLVSMLLALAIEKVAGNAGEGLAIALYAVAYVAGGSFALKAGVEALLQGTIDIDLLMVLAALGAAFVGAPLEGSILLFLFSFSNVLQAYAMDRTRSAIKALMKLRPKQAAVRRGDTTIVVPIERVMVGDCIVVKPGDRVALDGMVSAGESTVDQSSITGESMPVSKNLGDTVFAGTINKNGSLDVNVTRLAKDSTLAQLIKMVEEAQSEKAQTQRFLDRFGQYYAMAVILVTALAIVVPISIFFEAFHSAFYRAMTIMVAMSPCALVISTPASILSGIANGARRGVLFKGGVHLEQAANIKVVAFDKTGTLTEGKPRVTDVVILGEGGLATDQGIGSGADRESPVALPSSFVAPPSPIPLTPASLLALAAAVQSKSEHALARATLAAAAEYNTQVAEAFAFQATTGKGVRGLVDGRDIRVGNLRYFEGFNCIGQEEAAHEVLRLEREGKTGVVVGELGDDGETATLLGVIAFADLLRPGVAAIVRSIKAAGVERVVMLTGDNRHVAETIARQAGLDDFYAELLPEDKVKVVREIGEKYGPVAMVGDGVNDAPALATARLGIAMGAAGTDVALETADVVLMGDDLRHIPYLIALSRQTRRTLITNIGFAMFMIFLMLLAIFSIQLPLPLAVVGHEGGTVLVSLNGLRLLGYRYRTPEPAS